MIIASDGVWEFLTSQSVVDMVSQFEGPNAPLEACRAVVAESYRLWLQYEVRTDDITMIMLRIDNYKKAKDCGINVDDHDHDQMPTPEPEPKSLSLSASASVSPQASRRDNPGSKRHDTSYKEGAGGGSSIRFSKTAALVESGGVDGHLQRPVRRTMSKAKRRIIAERGSSLNAADTAAFVLEEHVVPKTEEEVARIENFIKANFLFQHMAPKQKRDAMMCMERVTVSPGQNVIVQGDKGDKGSFYIVESGRYDVSVRDEDGIMNVVLSYDNAGEAFGELSLMYGKPRAATVTAKVDGALWALNRTAFRGCMMKRNTATDLISVLKRVEILKTLSIPQLQRLCDLLAEEEFKAGEHVVKQGESGQQIFIVEEGELVVTKIDDTGNSGDFDKDSSGGSGSGSHGGHKETEMMTLKKNDYFGERALMYDEARAANVTCVTDCKLLATSRKAFEEVVGSLESIIAADQKRREDKKVSERSEREAYAKRTRSEAYAKRTRTRH